MTPFFALMTFRALLVVPAGYSLRAESVSTFRYAAGFAARFARALFVAATSPDRSFGLALILLLFLDARALGRLSESPLIL